MDARVGLPSVGSTSGAVGIAAGVTEIAIATGIEIATDAVR
jgi:hypothetical protein